MTRLRAQALAIVALGLAVPAAARGQVPARNRAQAQVLAPRFGFDPERIFMLGDADLDGRLSLDEYRDLLASTPRFRNATAMVEPMFRRLDANRDGFLSLGEYRRSFQPPPGGGPGFGFGGMRRPGPRPDAMPAPALAAREAPITAEQEAFFEAKVRPVLAARCVKCHSDGGAEAPRGGLRLDTREGLRRGGDSGPAIVPGRPDESLLVRAIRYDDEELQMPPKGKLPDAAIAGLEAWVKMGAPDPRTAAAGATSTATASLAKAREFWAFRAPKKVEPPAVSRTDWARDPIDRFLLAALEGRGLQPVGDADRGRLLRRLSFDLTGLPPTPEELDAFLADSRPDALAVVVDRLLASPRFGERWGRLWLDVARYAESSGKTNFLYPQAWRYRDWAIASINADKPYDRFVREQIAGDLLPAADDRARAEQLIATGFLALGSKAHDAENRGQYVLDVIDEQIEATTRAFLGLTVACARCHDHKVDPIPQRDYYALSGIFRSTQTCAGTLAGVFPNFNASPLIELPAGADVPSAVAPLSAELRATMEQRLAAMIRERDAIEPGEANRDRQRRITSMIATLRHRLLMDRPGDSPRAFAMGVLEREEVADSPLYVRGELDQPGEVVPRGLVRTIALDGSSPPITTGSGRRELADWLASPANPLTARVMVNRVWLHLFGRGLVATPDNFGASGARPSHPELLDALAVDFMADGWSVKRLIRRIVLSRAYGLDSAHDPRNFEADPDNTLVWRMSKRRLDAESVRDALLFVGGALAAERPVGSPVAKVGEGLAFFVRVDGVDAIDDHRSVYLPIIRDRVPEALALFDFADPSLVTGERAVTTGPAQALYFLNGRLALRMADALAGRVCQAEEDDGRRVDLAYRLALARPPTPRERERALAFLVDFAGRVGGDDSGRAAWVVFCQALFAGAEFRYVD